MTSRDPTRSAGLRKYGRDLVNRKVHSLHQALRQGFQEHDVVGLRSSEHPTSSRVMFINWMESVSHKLARAEGMIQEQIERTLLAPVDWPYELLERSVEHGIVLVEQELRTSLGHLAYTEVSRLQTGSATVEVRGIAGETERRLLRHVVRALETKEKPEALMRDVLQTIEKVTRLRLHLMINTGVVRAVNAGKLFAYEAEGIAQVGIDPEWLPAVAHAHRDTVGHHHHRTTRMVGLDAKTRKATRRNRVKANKLRRERRGRSAEEEILRAGLEGLLGGVGGPASDLIERLEEAEEAEPVLVGILTAGDDKVCQDCEDIAEDGPYEIDQARGLIPAHPNCRCAFVPWGDKRFAPIMEQDEEWD